MRTLSLTSSMLTFLDEVEFSEAALTFDEDANHLATPFKEACIDWALQFKNERACRRDVTRANASVAVCNRRLDRLTMRFSAALRAFEPARMDDFFCKLPPTVFTRRALRKQCEKTRDVTIPAIEALGASHPLYPFAAELKLRANEALSALDDRAKLGGARTLNASQIAAWKESINALRAKTYGELLKIAADKKFPRQWPETFFLQTSADEMIEEADEIEEEAPAHTP